MKYERYSLICRVFPKYWPYVISGDISLGSKKEITAEDVVGSDGVFDEFSGMDVLGIMSVWEDIPAALHAVNKMAQRHNAYKSPQNRFMHPAPLLLPRIRQAHFADLFLCCVICFFVLAANHKSGRHVDHGGALCRFGGCISFIFGPIDFAFVR